MNSSALGNLTMSDETAQPHMHGSGRGSGSGGRDKTPPWINPMQGDGSIVSGRGGKRPRERNNATTKLKSDVCEDYNSANGCHRSNCNKKHACSHCGIKNHAVPDCRIKNGNAKGSGKGRGGKKGKGKGK